MTTISPNESQEEQIAESFTAAQSENSESASSESVPDESLNIDPNMIIRWLQDSISAEKEIDQVEKLKEILQQKLINSNVNPISGKPPGVGVVPGYQFAVPNSNPYSGSVSNVFNISPVMSNVVGGNGGEIPAGTTSQVKKLQKKITSLFLKN